MHEDLLTGLTLVIVVSIAAQWLSWRVKLPSILLLLTFGILAGPVTGALDTDALLGDLLFPIVSLSVAIILFEGGLSLRLADLNEIGAVVRNLITIGVVITWGISTVAAHFILDLEWDLAILLGAVLVVTGPTVVIPLLNQIRPTARVSSILRWEGIAIDPVGAVLAVLVIEQILIEDVQLGVAILGIINTLIIGISIGYIGARFIIEMFSRYLVPESLQNPMVLMMVIGTFTLSDMLQAESGLLTVTVMGIAMANQKRLDVHHIVEFKETLQVLLISTLFILLGARLELSHITDLGINAVLFVLVLMFVARPLTVFVSAYRSGLTFKEKLFISWMAPRGIVAAAVASVFSLELINHGNEGAEILVPITFSVIIMTVAVYGLTGGYVARRLGVAQENPQGVMIVGAHGWARKIALKLREFNFRVLLVDSNISNIEKAEKVSLEVYYGNILNEPVIEDLNLNGIGYLMAMTTNDEVNALASIQFQNILGFKEVFQLPRPDSEGQNENFPKRLRGQTLFRQDATYDYLNFRFSTGARLENIVISNVARVQEYLETMLPFFVVTNDEQKQLMIWTSDIPPLLQVGYTLVGLVDPSDEEILESEVEVP